MRYALPVAGFMVLASVLAAAAQDAALAADRAAIDTCLQQQKDAPEHCIGAIYNPCTEAAGGGTTYGMGVCAERESAVWREMMDASLTRLSAGPLGRTQAEPYNRPPENKRKRAVPGSEIIADMQNTWLIWRAKMCDTQAMQYEGGSLSRVVYGQCVYEATAWHALWLKSLGEDAH